MRSPIVWNPKKILKILKTSHYSESFIFPQTLNSSITLFFSSDGYRESPGFDILISQIPCGSPAPSPIIPDPYSSRRGLLRPPPTSQSLSPVSEQSEAKLCNKLINNQLAVITSPNYPSDYPPYSRCSYIIHRSSPDICQVKLQFLNLDLEKTSDCRTDYLQIEQTNEKYCGRQWLLPDKSKFSTVNNILKAFNQGLVLEKNEKALCVAKKY